ncbi:molybdate ABC transporter substrate-binding protein [Psychrobacter aquaticus]|uniref:Molybdenum ABC transporter, periplasmic molybdenum-binding protein ModA n=1 Tax=Psychrobacter aquaticus CMS 56 TaxID=1354303 RepID=U4TCQ6_9GAMM|nr:molybdate ABC transporter substrate-binding protein [Psychrobacter aquaticus]ERL56248.1 Molybdenum ABC transporter, periplasmic molybdenum-binding protein ModA [Psychrobacter aquaticus CMS 56]
MVKPTVATSFFVCLLLLSACTQENSANTVPTANNSSEQTQTLRIAAAANLSDVLPKIIDDYKASKNTPEQHVEVTYASSGKLYAQIKAGAPYDVFLSANQDFPAKLAEERAVNATGQNNVAHQNDATYSPFTYARGQLALYSITKPLDKLNTASLTNVFISDINSKVTIANPELAPYGASAKAYLQSQNTYPILNKQKRLIQAENIGQAFQYVHTGSVDYGLVAQSQVIAIKAKPEQFITLAPVSYPEILQDGIVISDSNLAIDFTHYLRSKAGQQHFLQAGYLPV